MKNTIPLLSLALILGLMSSLASAAQETPTAGALPANIRAEQTKIIADRAVLKSDFHALRDGHQQLLSDEDGGKKDAIAKDKASLESLHAQLKGDFQAMRADRETFHKDVKPLLTSNKSAVEVAVQKLKNDRSSNNAQAISADMENIRRAVENLSSQKKAIFGPIHSEHGKHMGNMGQMGMHHGMGFGKEGREGFGEKMRDKGSFGRNDRQELKSDTDSVNASAPAISTDSQ